MTRTILPICVVIAACVGLSCAAGAPQSSIGVDGCDMLASIVYTEVAEATLGSCTGPYGELPYPGRNETTLCSQTTYRATAAFSSALRQANIFVTWGFHSGYTGGYCLSQSLSLCYPTGDPAMPPLSEDDWSFVVRSWEAVHDSIAARMSLRPRSDVSRFQGDELVRSIRRSIARNPLRERSVTRRSMSYNGPDCPPRNGRFDVMTSG